MSLFLSNIEQFRKDFVNQYGQKTHATRTFNKSAEKSANNLCISQSIRNILIQETEAMHKQGRKICCNQSYESYNHIGLIDAACVQGNLKTYSQLCNQFNQLQQQLQQQSNQLRQAQRDNQNIINSYTNSINTTVQQLQQERATSAQREIDYNNLNQQMNNIKKQNEQITKQLRQTQQGKDELLNLKQILDSNYSDLTQKELLLKQQQSTIQKQHNQMKNINEKLHQLQQQNENNKLLHKQNLLFKTRMDKYQRELLFMKHKLPKLQKENSKLKDINKKYSNDVFELVQQLNEHKEKLKKFKKRKSNSKTGSNNKRDNDKKRKYSSLSNGNNVNINSEKNNKNDDSQPLLKRRRIHKRQTDWSNKNIVAGTTFLMNSILSVVDRITQQYIIYYKYDHYDESIKYKDRRLSYHDKHAIFVGDIVTVNDGMSISVTSINIKDNESDGTISGKQVNDGKQISNISVSEVSVTDTKNRNVGITYRINNSIASVTGLICTLVYLLVL